MGITTTPVRDRPSRVSPANDGTCRHAITLGDVRAFPVNHPAGPVGGIAAARYTRLRYRRRESRQSVGNLQLMCPAIRASNYLLPGIAEHGSLFRKSAAVAFADRMRRLPNLMTCDDRLDSQVGGGDVSCSRQALAEAGIPRSRPATRVGFSGGKAHPSQPWGDSRGFLTSQLPGATGAVETRGRGFRPSVRLLGGALR